LGFVRRVWWRGAWGAGDAKSIAMPNEGSPMLEIDFVMLVKKARSTRAVCRKPYRI
jgi:hypothetical protein